MSERKMIPLDIILELKKIAEFLLFRDYKNYRKFKIVKNILEKIQFAFFYPFPPYLIPLFRDTPIFWLVLHTILFTIQGFVLT